MVFSFLSPSYVFTSAEKKSNYQVEGGADFKMYIPLRMLDVNVWLFQASSIQNTFYKTHFHLTKMEQNKQPAGLSSNRLSDINTVGRHEKTTVVNSQKWKYPYNNSEMFEILRSPTNNNPCQQKRFERQPEALEYAGRTTCSINAHLYNKGSKKHAKEFNESRGVASVISTTDAAIPIEKVGIRSLKQYFSADELTKAFCTKFHVTNPVTGKTEIMIARRPGKASAEVNVADFDAYQIRNERTFSLKKSKDNIEHNVTVRGSVNGLPLELPFLLNEAWNGCQYRNVRFLRYGVCGQGIMPKENSEAKYRPCASRGLASSAQHAATLECKDVMHVCQCFVGLLRRSRVGS